MRLVHFGTFDVENFGDLLFPLIARHRLAAAEIELTFVSPVGGPPVWQDCAESISPSAVEALDVDGVLLEGETSCTPGWPASTRTVAIVLQP